MKVKVFEDYEAMSAAAANAIIEVVREKPEAVLCFATGNTPVGTYRLLAEKVKAQGLDFSKCFCIGLDEWLGVPGEKRGSCHYILWEQVFRPLGIDKAQVHLFDGMTGDVESECRKMNEVIESKGGIDCMIVGVGLNGHIGFNEPGVSISLQAHEQGLHETTLGSGQHYFNEPTVIKKGITLGMTQVMSARMVLLLANGKNKAAIIKKAVKGDMTNAIPASYIQRHTGGVVILDKEAASELIN